MNETEKLATFPLLPLKGSVLFPSLLLPLSVSRPNSVAAVEAALAREDKTLVVFTQRDAAKEDPSDQDLHSVGTRATIIKMARSERSIEVIVQGVERVGLVKLESQVHARVRPLALPDDNGTEQEALTRAVVDLAARAQRIAQIETPTELSQIASRIGDNVTFLYLITSMLSLDVTKQQALLEAATRLDALQLAHQYLTHELQVLELQQKISSQAQSEITKEQRDYVLRQQLRAIQDELGESDPESGEVTLLRQQLDELDLPEEVRKEANRELTRLERLPAAAPDHQVARSYLEMILELPWKKQTEDQLDLAHARQVLDEDHFGLKEVKERILEHLAVLKLNPEAKAPILCFVGPPGVGKTSLGQSIARALGRQFERLSLGGLHDEAELRGHRRTYIGAMPGRIIQAMRRAGVNNPLLMLDEVDKLGRDFRGDPAAALLEILDPAQNHSFRDNYLDLPFDLSKVFFVTTANTLDTIPQPLLDRMEILRLTGYSEEEKMAIARRYLIPRQVKETGLSVEQLDLSDETLSRIISRYTREAGLRQLERALGRLARKLALRRAEGGETPSIDPADLHDLLGSERFFLERARQQSPPGVATGLAWTESGGDVLYVEAAHLPGGRGLTMTGQLGGVMQESAQAAQSCLWSLSDELGIDQSMFRKGGVHLHVPAGAIPKDGPSAGITIAAALASLYTHEPIRRDTAMTGEITLTGLVLPIGGVREKVLAARRAGLRRVVLPRDNEKDLRDLPENVRNEMEFVFAERIEEVLTAAIPALEERLHAAAA